MVKTVDENVFLGVVVVVLVAVVEVVVFICVVIGSMVCARKEKDGNRCLLSCQCGCDIIAVVVPGDFTVVVEHGVIVVVADEVVVVAEYMVENSGRHSEGDDDENRLRHGGGGDVDIVGHGDGDDGATVELLQEFMAANGGESGANVQTGKYIVKHSFAESLQGVLETNEKGWCTCKSENIG